jgi:hypothetical protein
LTHLRRRGIIDKLGKIKYKEAPDFCRGMKIFALKKPTIDEILQSYLVLCSSIFHQKAVGLRISTFEEELTKIKRVFT